MTAATVVPKTQRFTKPQLHADLMLGWARVIARLGKGRFADLMEISTAGVDKQLQGSMPNFEQIISALAAEPHVLDDVLRRMGKRIADADPACDVDDMSLLMARVLVMIQEAEHPEGPGGRAIVPQEYLAGEELMRELHQSTGRWLERCHEIKRPRIVAG